MLLSELSSELRLISLRASLSNALWRAFTGNIRGNPYNPIRGMKICGREINLSGAEGLVFKL